MPALSFVDLAGAAGLGLVAALGARTFAWMLLAAKRIADRGHAAIRVAAAGGAIAILFAIGRSLTGESLVFDAGLWRSQLGAGSETECRDLARDVVLRCITTTATGPEVESEVSSFRSSSPAPCSDAPSVSSSAETTRSS